MGKYDTNYILTQGENTPALCDKETERKVLGELTRLSGKQVRHALDSLTIDSFYVSLHRRVYSYIVEINKRGEKVDLSTINNEWLKEVAKPTDVPLLDLVEITEQGYDSYTELPLAISMLTEMEKRRKLWILGQQMIESGCNRGEDVEEVMESVRKGLSDIAGRGNGDIITMTSVLENISQIVKDNQEGKLSERVTLSGIDEFDKLGGLQSSDLIIIAAESSMGKTAFANTITHNVIKAGHKVAFYSLEMTKEQLTARLISSITGIKANNILSSVLSSRDMETMQHCYSQMARYADNLYFEDKSTNTIDSILNSIRRMYYRYNVRGVVIDYLQLISGRYKSSNKTAFIGEVTRELKNIAKELGIWVILLSQLNRNKEDGNPFPTSDRLRDSGEILEACDVCLLIYRPDYYNKYLGKNLSYPAPYKEVSVEKTAMVIQSKGRNTGTGKWIMRFDPERTTYENIDQDRLPTIGVRDIDKTIETIDRYSREKDDDDDIMPF